MLELERYAVVSCHVERPLDDASWDAFSRFQASCPGGFTIAALLRPPDAASGESFEPWAERARAAAARGPVGHHTHFGGPEQARPLGPGAADRLRREAGDFHRAGVAARFFCGGAWYMDAEVAAACVDAGYVDCTATAYRLPYLPPEAPRVSLAAPAWLRLDGERRLLELPATHSVGMLARGVLARDGLRGAPVHVHFHDWDLLRTPTRLALAAALRLLRLRRRPLDLATLAEAAAANAGEVEFTDVAAP